MKLVTFPVNTRMSGQACAAMLLGISLDRAVELAGTRAQMSTRALVGLLRQHNVNFASRRVTSRGYHPDHCLLFAVPSFSKSRASGHWMLQWDGVTLDPREDSTGDRVIVSYVPLEEHGTL